MGDLKMSQMADLVKIKLSNPANVDDDFLQEVIKESVALYSNYRPQIKVVDTVGDGGFVYSLPSGFVEEFSRVVAIEYPLNEATQDIPLLKEGIAWIFYRDTDAIKLKFLKSSPATTESFRTTFTLPHSITGAATTIPEVDERAVSNFAAALLGEMLAAEFEKKSRSTIPEGTFDLRTKAQEYQTQSDRYYKLWRMQMGIDEDGRPAAAVGWTDTDWYYQSGAAPLTHGDQ